MPATAACYTPGDVLPAAVSAGDEATVPLTVRPVDLLADEFDVYHSTVYKYLLFRVHDSELAEELTAETFYAAASRPEYRLRDAAKLRAWLLRIATNLTNTRYRKRRVRELFLGRRAQEHSPFATGAATDAQSMDPSITCVRAIVARLRPRYQAVVALRYFSSLSFYEIGEVLGLRPDAVRTRLCRAVKEIRGRLASEGS